MTITKAQIAKTARGSGGAAMATACMVEFCMRYGNPSTKSKVVRRMVAEGCDKILFFPLYPQYAGATTGHRQ